MKKTALDWFLTEFKKEVWFEPDSELDIWINKLIPKAKEMEKEQHQETWNVAHQAGRFEGKGIAEDNWQTFQTYWEENFKQQEQ